MVSNILEEVGTQLEYEGKKALLLILCASGTGSSSTIIYPIFPREIENFLGGKFPDEAPQSPVRKKYFIMLMTID